MATLRHVFYLGHKLYNPPDLGSLKQIITYKFAYCAKELLRYYQILALFGTTIVYGTTIHIYNNKIKKLRVAPFNYT